MRSFRIALVWLATMVLPAWGVPRTVDPIGSSGIQPRVNAYSMAVSPDGAHVYVPSKNASMLTTFSRAAGTGILTRIGEVGVLAPAAVVVSPDGAHVYVLTADSFLDYQDVNVFSRNAATGALTLVESFTNPDDIEGLYGAAALALSGDGAHLYVASAASDAVLVFERNPGTGALTFVEAEIDYFHALGLWSANAVAVSADGANVYVAGLDTVVTFSRNAGTGELTFVEFEHQSVGGVDGLSNATDVAVSPDDGHVYVTGALDGTVAVFDRDPGTGALSFVAVERNGVGGVDGLGSAETIRLSPDGTDVYVAGPGDDAVAVFRRDPGTGALTFTEVQRDGLGGAEGLESARGLAFDPTGTHLYLGATHDAVVFSRTAATGALAFVDAVPDGLATLGAIAISPDGAHVYVTTGVAPFPYEQNGVAVLGRDAGTGLLAFIDVERDGVNGVQGLAGPRGVTVSPDGAHVYVVGDGSPAGGAVAAFSRNAGNGELTFVEAESDGVGGVDGLGGAEGITVSPDGAHVYVASTVDDAVAVFGRNAGTGALTFVEAQFDGVGGVEGLGGAISVAVSPDGAHVYVSGHQDYAVAVFSRNAATGALAFVEAQRELTPGIDGLVDVRQVVLSPDGANVYAAGAYDDDVVVFSRNAATGALTLIEVERWLKNGVNGLDEPRWIAVSPDGGALYVGARFNFGTLAVFSRHPGTGTLSFVEFETIGYTLGSALALSPDGAHVYAGGYRDVAGFAVGSFTGCEAEPIAPCRSSSRGSLGLSSSKRLSWRWLHGPATDPGAFGAPETTTDYAFCLYDESGPTPAVVLRAMAPAGGDCGPPCWKPNEQGLLYRDGFRTPEGLLSMSLRAGGDDQAQVKVRANGPDLDASAPPLTLPLRAQLQNENGECWEATYSAARTNSDRRFAAHPD